MSDGWTLAAALILAGQPDEPCCTPPVNERVQDVRRPALYHRRDSSVVRHRTSAPLLSRLRISAYLREVFR